MSNLVRISLSIEEPLLSQLERLVKDYQYANRSEFVRDMIRECLVEQEWEQNREVVGTITLLYNHHIR
jgi:CopG family nickel-responsive transcriptional regulator